MTGRAKRLAAVVAAGRAEAQGRLAACLAEQRQLRERAADLTRTARAAVPGGDAADMAQTARWQAHLRDAVRDALARAEALEDEAGRRRGVLARALGRERAVDALVAAERAARRQRAERRAENSVPAPGAGSSLSGPSRRAD